MDTMNSYTIKVAMFLDEIIIDHERIFKRENNFKVRTNYGDGKYYLNRTDGSYDMSIHSLIHHIMNEEGVYEEILSPSQWIELKRMVQEEPESIFNLNYDNEEYDEDVQSMLDGIRWGCVKYVGQQLKHRGFDVSGEFSEWLD